ncbi:hypothetical protein SAMN05216370_0032 [Pseudomonas peli]|uniref:Uncharacterized protein n=1 Tax=Pseudomonas peli TaxID=592361 RepID=A0AB37ZDF1_9PSED|nr:hypothetical protein [Pseudomonas peli]NMZ71351.1 hypothetical protein [Pseudomonas peli]SCW89354.1 hypothetical protein SAMN05216370_0032 [Pseudomonas peli]
MKGDFRYQVDAEQQAHPVGTRVKGVFYGVQYRGVVTASTPHSRSLAHIHQVKLDQPIAVFGVVRERIHVPIWEPAPSGHTIEADPTG